jgi:hypothetical protein
MPTPWICQVIYSIPITHLLLYTVYLITMSNSNGSRMYAPKKTDGRTLKTNHLCVEELPILEPGPWPFVHIMIMRFGGKKHDPQTFPENFPVNQPIDIPLTITY